MRTEDIIAKDADSDYDKLLHLNLWNVSFMRPKAKNDLCLIKHGHHLNNWSSQRMISKLSEPASRAEQNESTPQIFWTHAI